MIPSGKLQFAFEVGSCVEYTLFFLDTLQPPTMVDFPRVDPRLSAHLPDLHLQPTQHLPFRRISLPSAPELLNRQSIVSTLSVDSLPENRPMPTSPLPSIMRDVTKRHSAVDGGRRLSRRREVKIVDEQAEAKQRKVAEEFYDTEKSYVEGLELIYSVRPLLDASSILAH